MAVLAPCVADVEVVADSREAARDVQRVRIRRRVEEQRMRLAWLPVVLEDTDVLDSGPAFTSIANPPHDVPSSPRRNYRISLSREARGSIRPRMLTVLS